MKKYVLSACVAITSIICISCSGGKSIEKIVPVSNVEITGNGADYISINGDVKLYMVKSSQSEKYWSIRATVPIENRKVVSGAFSVKSELNLLDENYSKIDDHYSMYIQDAPTFSSLLKSEVGTNKMIAFQPIWESLSYKEYKTVVDIIEKSQNITLNLEIQNVPESSSTSKTSTVSSTSSSNNWDSVLNEYDNFVNEYIKFYKKAMDGDLSALTEYSSYLEKIETLSDKLDAAEGNMTSAQLNRYLKITERMTNAMLDD